MSSYELAIDSSGAERGANEIVRSFDKIKAAADRMEGGVSAAARKASASFGELQKNAKPISAQAIQSLNQLSSAFKSFRAPSDAAVRNTIIFLQGLKSVGTLNLGRVSGLAGLLAAISGYRGPSATAGKNTLALLNSLRFVASFSSPRGLAATLAVLSSFRGPSSAAARNVTSLLTALSSFRGGPGLTASIRALDSLTRAANAARSSLNSLKGAGPGTVNIRANTSNASSGMKDLIKTQGFLQTAIFRTQTAWNALGGILAGRAIIGASNDLIKIHAQLQAATGSATKAGFAFGFLREFAEKLGLEFRSAAQSFGFFLGSVKGTNLTLDESRQIFVGFSTAARALQLSTADVDGVFRALGQMMSKGKIQAEELRGQLGDRLPGAFVRFAVALKMTKPGELDQALKKGAVSGEKMKQAIIDVANALRVEFAGSADKMSKTVDAAFNRLKNAFTFAASALGTSGLNQAMISLLDTATKLLQSNTFNFFMTALGKVFKFLGDHIEVFTTILATVAISNTLKWAASLVGLTGATVSATVATEGAAVAAAAEGTAATEAAVATTAWGTAWARLNLLMKANIFLLLASAIIGVMLAFKKNTSAVDENAKAIDAVNASMPNAALASDVYAERLLNLADSANQVTTSLQQMIQKMNEAALRASQEDLKGIDLYKNVGIVGNYGVNIQSGRGNLPKGPEGYFKDEDLALLNRVAYKTQTGGVALRGNIPQTKQEFEQLLAANALIGTRATGPGGGNFAPVQSALQGRINALISQSQQKGYKGLPYSAWTEQIIPGYTKPTGGIEGGAPIGKTKKGPKSDAEKAADDIAAAIDAALKGLGDLEVRASSTADTISGLLSGSFDKYTAAAHTAALAQEKNFEDQIRGHGKVSELQAQHQAVEGLAQKLQQQGKIGAEVDISSYEKAKAAVINYMEVTQKLDAQRQKDEEIAQSVADLRDQNKINEEANALLKLGMTQSQVNEYMEVENKLLGASVEERPILKAALEDEIQKREQLRRELELTNAQRELENQKVSNSFLKPMYQKGVKSEDIDYYREMFDYRQKLMQDGFFGDQLRGMVSVHAATLNEARAQKDLADAYERTRQTAQDMADAIVDGFRQGMQDGSSFLKIMKNIFTELKNIILDFVLYNPLRKWLADIFQQGISATGIGAVPGAGVASTGGANNYSTPGGIASGVINSVNNSLISSAGGFDASEGANNPSGPVGTGGRYQWVNDFLQTVGQGAIAATQGPGGSIIVTAPRPTPQDTNAPIPPPTKTVSFLENFNQTMKSTQQGFKDFTNFVKTGKGASAGIQGAIGAAGTAFAMYQVGDTLGKGVAKALGGGFRTQAVAGGALGGAAAGYTIGGPVGAAIGAVVGGILGFLKKRPEIPSSYGAVTVGPGGVAVAGATGTHGPANAQIGKDMANAAASMFNNFIIEFGAKLVPGNFGTFGSREFNPPGPGNKATMSFYSTQGVDSNGRPLGVEGVDWTKGTDSQIQAFAIIKQVRDGMITGLNDTIKTVFANTKATSMESLQSDLDVGRAYDEFIKGSFHITELASKVRDLNQTFKTLSSQAAALGLSETKLQQARERMMKDMRDEFNFSISQGILGISNPAMAAYNQLVSEYHNAVEEAMAVGGDLSAVEKYYGMQRAELAKQWADIATNGLVSAARDLYNQMTASSSSPLNAGSVLAKSQDLYSGLIGQLKKGDYTNVGQLSTYSQNYLDAARSVFGSSTEYFDIFKAVTDTLNQFSNLAGTAGIGGPPKLPSLDSIVAEINTQSLEMIDAMGIVGQAVVEGSTSIVDAINNLAIALGYTPAPVTAPPTTPTPPPTTGGGGVVPVPPGGTGGGAVYSSGPGTAVGGGMGGGGFARSGAGYRVQRV